MLDSTLEVTSTNDQEATPSDSVTDDAVTELPTSSRLYKVYPMTRYPRRVYM